MKYHMFLFVVAIFLLTTKQVQSKKGQIQQVNVYKLSIDDTAQNNNVPHVKVVKESPSKHLTDSSDVEDVQIFRQPSKYHEKKSKNHSNKDRTYMHIYKLTDDGNKKDTSQKPSYLDFYKKYLEIDAKRDPKKDIINLLGVEDIPSEEVFNYYSKDNEHTKQDKNIRPPLKYYKLDTYGDGSSEEPHYKLKDYDKSNVVSDKKENYEHDENTYDILEQVEDLINKYYKQSIDNKSPENKNIKLVNSHIDYYPNNHYTNYMDRQEHKSWFLPKTNHMKTKLIKKFPTIPTYLRRRRDDVDLEKYRTDAPRRRPHRNIYDEKSE